MKFSPSGFISQLRILNSKLFPSLPSKDKTFFICFRSRGASHPVDLLCHDVSLQCLVVNMQIAVFDLKIVF